MEEEKGGIIHIFFIFVGITLLLLGLFYTFTDEKIDLKENTMDVHGIEDDTNNDKDNRYFGRAFIMCLCVISFVFILFEVQLSFLDFWD